MDDMGRYSFRWVLALVLVALPSIYTDAVSADSLQSSNFRFTETAIGSGGLVQSTSANFKARDAVGDIGIGTSASSNFQIAAGNVTTNDPSLSLSFNSNGVALGDFSSASATTTTATFTILNYTSYGYVAQIIGNPPSNGAYSLTAMSTTGASTPGTSQYGINLVANTSPASVGANPNNGSFGFGQVAPNYSTPNQFRYVSGETIALAPKSSGLTTYTITYLVNVAGLTPGGQFTSNQTIIVTGTY